MTTYVRREVIALLLILAAGLILAGWFHNRPGAGNQTTYRVVWHQNGQALEELGDRTCVASGRPGFVTCTDMDPMYPCLLKRPTEGTPFVACGLPRDNTLDDAPEKWSR